MNRDDHQSRYMKMFAAKQIYEEIYSEPLIMLADRVADVDG